MITVIMILAFIICTATTTQWVDSIHNPENAEFVAEIAFNKDITVYEVTQEMFNERYKDTLTK